MELPSGPPIPDREALLRRAIALGVVPAVGPLPLQNYYAGRRVIAHFMLRKRRPPGPASVVAPLLADASLWIDPPPDVPPPRLDDDGLPDVLGHPVRTYWRRTLGVRVSPEANYLVSRWGAAEVLGQVPLTEAQERVRFWRPAAVLAGFAAVGFAVVLPLWPHHVYVANGLPTPIEAKIGGETLRIGARGWASTWAYGWETLLSATAAGTTIDEVTAPLAFGTLVYCPGNLATLALVDVPYGAATARETTFLPRETVQAVSADVLFAEPPETVEGNGPKHLSWLVNPLADPTWENDSQRLAFVFRQYGPEAAGEWARAQVTFAPDQAELARAVEPTTGPELLAYWADLHARAPESAAVWRRYGELQPERAAFLAEVRSSGRKAAPLLEALFDPDPATAQSRGHDAVEVLERNAEQATAHEAIADGRARLADWVGAEETWNDVLRSAKGDHGLARRERARVRRLGGLPAPTMVDADQLPDEERVVEECLHALAEPASAEAIVAATDSYADPAYARLQLALALGDAPGARLTVNTMGQGDVARPYALRVDAGPGGDRGRLTTLLAEVGPLAPAWTRVAASIAEALHLPSAAAWAAAADVDGDGGPRLAELRGLARVPPSLDALRPWAPRHWALAALAAGWFAEATGDLPARDAWFALAGRAALPGELLAIAPALPEAP